MQRILLTGVVLSSVCLATWFVTRSLTAQVLRKRTAGQTTNAQTTPTVVKTVESRLAGTSTPAKALLPPGYIALPSPGPIAEFRLKDHQLSLVGNRLKVNTSVEIIDHRAGDVLRLGADVRPRYQRRAGRASGDQDGL